MSAAPDYEFGFGKDRYLKGRGWRGLVALALLVTGMLVIGAIGLPLLRIGFLSVAPALRVEAGGTVAGDRGKGTDGRAPNRM